MPWLDYEQFTCFSFIAAIAFFLMLSSIAATKEFVFLNLWCGIPLCTYTVCIRTICRLIDKNIQNVLLGTCKSQSTVVALDNFHGFLAL